VTLSVRDTQIFTATGYDQNGKPIDFTPKYSTDGGGTIDQNGKYTATNEGNYTVTASNEDASITGSATVTVNTETEGDESNLGWYIGGVALAGIAAAGAFVFRDKIKGTK
jgi:uncharacterized protein YjdB